jgi:hypothetical protein
MATPQVRALTSQVALQHIDRLPAAQRDAILVAVGDVTGARDAFQFNWIPFATQIRILDAMRAHLKPADWIASQRALMHAYLDKPVLRGLFDTAVRMLGLSVPTLARWAPRAFDALFKEAGLLRFEPGSATELALVLERFPTALMSSGSFVESLQAALETIFTLTKTTGRVEVADFDPARGHARYTLRWSAS